MCAQRVGFEEWKIRQPANYKGGESEGAGGIGHIARIFLINPRLFQLLCGCSFYGGDTFSEA